MHGAHGVLMTELTQAGWTTKPLISAAVVTGGVWHRVGLVWDGSVRTVTVDDVEVAGDTQTGLPTPVAGLDIGAGAKPAPGNFWSGLIDEVKIHNRAANP
jgi:hypothetical protein